MGKISAFTWANFDSDFLLDILNSGKVPSDCKPTVETQESDLLATGLNRYYPQPDEAFVNRFQEEIGRSFFGKYPDRLHEVMGASEDMDIDMYAACLLEEFVRQPMTTGRAEKVIAALRSVGSEEGEAPSRFTVKPDPVDLRTSEVRVDLFEYQEKAVKALQNAFVQENRQNGLLVMPTGSGKTMTAAYFLLRDMISAGYQVVWLAHRHMLLTQAAGAFYDNCPLIRLKNFAKERFQLSCVSGEHDSIKSVESDDDAVFLSVQSVVRNLNYLDDVLRKDRLVIVVDEAHHTTAPSYIKTINYIRELNPGAKLLGLTATPIRGRLDKNEKDSAPNQETAYLHKIFTDSGEGSPIIYEISTGELIEGAFLAKPKVVHVATGENFESRITPNEARQIAQFNDIPESLVNKIAGSRQRNELIVKQYMDNRDTYKKTLIFALNTVHAQMLHDDLVKKGVKCGCVYSGNPMNTPVIEKFRNNELDVLININIMTEGSDVPDVQTVMLTRPTGSDVLMMQMIGRAMRGSKVGGTDTATIVDFHDLWGRYNVFTNPEWLLHPTEPEAPETPTTEAVLVTYIPWALVRDIYRGIEVTLGEWGSFVAMPYGWYGLLDDGEDYTLLVFEDQVAGYAKLIEDFSASTPTDDLNAILDRYFGGFCLRPSEKDLAVFLRHLKQEKEPPLLFMFEGRDRVDPLAVAKKMLADNRSLMDVSKYLEELHKEHPVIERLFSSPENYSEKVFHIISRIISGTLNPERDIRPIEPERIPFEIDRAHDVEALMREVIEERFQGKYPGIRSIRWTDRPYSSCYGMYTPVASEDGKMVGDVAINLLLNSSRVPREVVKYVIYHELLHRDHPGHGPKFREMEHQYPNYVDWERFLDYRLPRFYDFPYFDENNREAAEKLSFDAGATMPGVEDLLKAAETGDVEAQYKAGVMYDVGKEVKQDPVRALSWYRKSAEAGNAEAQYKVGLFYQQGKGVETDLDQALSWYIRAARNGHYLAGLAKQRLQEKHGDEVSLNFRDLLKAAEAGDTEAQFKLGAMYDEGEEIKQDHAKALSWYRKSAEAGNARAQYTLGRICFNGEIVKRNYAEAFSWYSRAADAGDIDAQAGLAGMYYYGRYVRRDHSQAFSLYRKAAEAGNIGAQVALARMYESGKGVERDREQAAFWYGKAEQQDPAARARLLFGHL